MIKTVKVFENSSAERLLDLWAQRYAPDLSSLDLDSNTFNYEKLRRTTSEEGRSETVSKLTNTLLDVNSQMAWVQTKTLHDYIPNVLNLNEARQITQFATRIYRKLLQLYQQPSLNTTVLPTERLSELVLSSRLSWRKSAVTQISYELEPTLLIYQEQLMVSRDWRTLGFMTTQLKFTNRLILRRLTDVERTLFSPYLKFIEEQVAIPWQRVSAAATGHQLGSLTLNLVEEMIPACDEISETVHNQLVQMFPNYHSRSGCLTDPNVAHSNVRDLNMFQTYLWLSLLERSLTPIKQELFNLCMMVLNCIGITSEFTAISVQLLTNNVVNRLSPGGQALLQPYIEGMQGMFLENNTMNFQSNRLGKNDIMGR